jgi:hypothetical protein
MAKGGTHYGNMFDNKKLLTPDQSTEQHTNINKNKGDGSIVISVNNNSK